MTEITSYMDQFGDTLLENGYRIIPIIPSMKVPGRFANGQWYPLTNWSMHCERDTKPFELDMWKRWPGCAIGLACGEVIGIDIDVLSDPEVAYQLEKLAREMLGDTPALRIGNAPKRALFYRAEIPFAGRKMHPIEVYGRGSQMVIYATHPDTGKPYLWPGESLTEIDISQLPVITEAQAMGWLEKAYRRIPASLKPKTLAKSEGKSEWAGPSDPKGTYAAVKSALEYIPNANLDGSSWVAIMNAIKAALGDAGLDLWVEWSQSSSKSGASGKTNTAERRYASAKPVSIGAGTIYYLAEQRGWIPGADLILNGSVAGDPDAPHPAAALLARMGGVGQPVAPLPPVPVPVALYQVGGVLGMLIDLAVRTAKRPQPFLALAAALCCVGTVAGRKYKTSTNLRTNLYAVSLAASGAGKDNARVVVKEVLYQAGLSAYLGGEFIASGSALLSSLKKHPCRLFQLDEVGKFIAECTTKNASPHKKEIWKNLTQLFTSAGTMMPGTEYANQIERPREDIAQPCASIYGVTVPETFWDALDGGAMSDGSVARFVVFMTDNNYPDRNKRPDPLVISQELIEGLQAVALGMDEAPKDGNLVGLLPQVPTPYTVPIDAEAYVLFDEQDDSEDGWLRQAEGGQNGAILARICENTRKIALIRAISDNPKDPRITADIVRWAQKLVEHCAHTLTREGDRYISTNETEGLHKSVLAIIRKAGTMSATELTRKTQKMNVRTRGDIIRALLDGEQITEDMGATGRAGRPVKRYSIVADDDVTGLTRH